MKPTEFLREFNEKDSGEYNDEAGMAQSNLETIVRSAQELEKHIGQEENLPEWCQEKLAVVKGMLTAVTDYMVSQDALDAKQDDFAFNTDRIAEQLDSMLEGGPYDLPGIDYDRPGDTPRKPKSHGGSIPRRHDDEPDFMDPDQRRLRADQARVKKAQDEYHAKKKSGMAEGEIEKTPTGIIHRAEKRQASRAPEMDRLDKGTTNNLDKGIGVHWDKTPGRGRHGIIDPTVDEQGVAEGEINDPLNPNRMDNRNRPTKRNIQARLGHDERGDARVRAGQERSTHARHKPQLPESAMDNNAIWSRYGHYSVGDLQAEFPNLSPKDAQTIVNFAEYGWTTVPNRQEYRDEVVKRVQQAMSGQQGVAEGHADQQRKIFKKNGHPVGEVGIDRESSPGNGQWYMKYYATGDDFSGYDRMEEAVADLKHLVNQFKAEGVAEEWSQKYKKSINCSHPRGFSQKAHCAGKKKHNESAELDNVCPDCGFSEQGLLEAKKGLYYYVNKRKKAGTSRPANHPKAPTAQAWKDAAKTAKKESMDYESQVDALLNEFAGGMGAASVATAPGVGKGPKVGTLFGGSYTPKTPFNKKRKR